MKNVLLFTLLFLFFINANTQNDSIKTRYKSLSYTYPGLQFISKNQNNKIHLNFRIQTRAFVNFDDDPVTSSEFDSFTNDILINRARIKLGGHFYRKWLKYYAEFGIVSGKQLDLRLYIEKWDFLKFKIGQWKSRYSVERMISSGAQQTVERSIINRPFTIDRQIGASIYGNIIGTKAMNFSYWLSIFKGDGRGNLTNEDDYNMYMSRLQWNINGVETKFSGSDLNLSEKFISYLAIAGVTNRSKYTAFSTNGGEFLEGYENAEEGQYRVNQYLIETSFKYKGWYFQQEYHWKEIDDKIYDNPTNHLTGNYLQLGYMIGQKINFLPKYFELYGRHAFYDPNRSIANDLQQEYTFGLNWFIKGHNNKLTFEYSYLEYQSLENIEDLDGSRLRLQWDFSF